MFIPPFYCCQLLLFLNKGFLFSFSLRYTLPEISGALYIKIAMIELNDHGYSPFSFI